MKKLVLALAFILLIRPVFAFSYAEELSNANETSSIITNIMYEGKDYLLYGLYQNSQIDFILIQDSLDNLITSNQTVKDVFYAYRYGTSSSVTNPRIASDRDFNLFFNRLKEKKDYINNKISDIERASPHYQSLIVNLSSQDAYASKSIKLFSDMQQMIWQAKMFLYQNKFNSADKALEDAKAIVPRITLDVRSSFRVNEGNLALEKVLETINNARSQGYYTKNIEVMFDDANSLLTNAKNSYMNEEYDGIDSKIASALESADKISYEIEKLKSPSRQTQTTTAQQPTGLMIVNYPETYYVLGVAIIVLVVLIILKISRRKKELRGISKLVRIKSRLE